MTTDYNDTLYEEEYDDEYDEEAYVESESDLSTFNNAFEEYKLQVKRQIKMKEDEKLRILNEQALEYIAPDEGISMDLGEMGFHTRNLWNGVYSDVTNGTFTTGSINRNNGWFYFGLTLFFVCILIYVIFLIISY